MRAVILILFSLQACFSRRLQLVLPDGYQLDSQNSSFNSQSLLEFSKNVLGIESGTNATHKLTGGDLFSRPSALIVVSISGLENFDNDENSYDFVGNFDSQQILDSLKLHFGSDMTHAVVNSSGVFGSPHFKRNALVDSENDSGNQDILNMEKLAEAIREKDQKTDNVIDYYRIHLDVSNARSAAEKKQLENNIKSGITNLQDAISMTQNRSILIMEIFHGAVINEGTRIKNLRKLFHVEQPRFQDYPARFSIAVLICVGLIFAVVSMIWFMFDESDMGKNSLVYRLSTARQKKD